MRADEDVLDDVLGIVLGAAQAGAGIADEGLAVAVVELRERGAVARRDAAGELDVVRTGALEQWGHTVIDGARPARRVAGWVLTGESVDAALDLAAGPSGAGAPPLRPSGAAARRGAPG